MVVIASLQRDVIQGAVCAMYTDVAEQPFRQFHFPTGRPACEFVGYPSDLLDQLPVRAVESFAGVGYPFATACIRPGDTVLDIGSGSGTDVFVARERVGARGYVYGVDMTPAMREKLTAIAAAVGAANIWVLAGNAEDIPLPNASVDVITSNGVLNLVPDKARAFAEIARVLRPGGRVQIADIVLIRLASDACRREPQLWAECIVGATTETDYVRGLEAAGLADVRLLHSLDYFAGSASVQTRNVAQSLGAMAVVLTARKAAVS